MPTLTPAFHAESEKIHHDHYALQEELRELDLALKALPVHSEIGQDSAPAHTINRCAQHLAAYLPAHFVHEEETLLKTVSEISPELRNFATEMKNQHRQLQGRMHRFLCAIEQLDEGVNIPEAVLELKKEGLTFAEELARHVSIEEHELSGFL